MIKALAVSILLAALAGCTVVHYDADGAWAVSILQTRTLAFSDADSTRTLTLNYNSSGDMATISAITAAAVAGAIQGAKIP